MKMKLACISLLAAALAASSAQALPFFGKKKAEKEQALPGMDAGAADASQLPKMAQEAEKDKPEEAPPEPAEERAVREEAPPSESETAVGEHPSGDSLPQEVVIRGKGGGKVKVLKPPLHIEVDAFESIRDSLQPDQNLLLAESPLTVVWRRTHPEFVRNARTVDPALTTFSERPGVVFSPLRELSKVLERRLAPKEAKGFEWKLTVADEEGKVFQHYEGSSYPPMDLVWSGQNDQGEWMRAGASYSPVYQFTDPNGTPYTRVGAPLRFKGILHQERDGLHITLDSASLFGKAKAAEKLSPEGLDLVRSAADLIKRSYSGVPIRVEAYASSKDLAERQAQDVEANLAKELMLLPQDISTDVLQTPYSDQRLEIVLLNR